MNRHDTGNISYLRRRYGLTWRSTRPTLQDVRSDWVAGIVVAIGFLLLIGMIDAADARVTAEIEARQSSQQFADFLNGGTIVSEDGTFAAKCEQMVEVVQ